MTGDDLSSFPGGPGDIDALGGVVDTAGAAERLFDLANALRPRERAFCEYLVEYRDEREALFAGWPELRFESSPRIASALQSCRRNVRIVDYIEASLGYHALTAGLSYRAILERMHDEALDPRTPPRERAALLSSLADHLWKNGVAAKGGFQGGGKQHDKDVQAGGVTQVRLSAFRKALSATAEIPEAAG